MKNEPFNNKNEMYKKFLNQNEACIFYISYLIRMDSKSDGFNMVKNREKFAKLAGQRVNKTMKMLDFIGNLSNRSNYSYTQTKKKYGN